CNRGRRGSEAVAVNLVGTGMCVFFFFFSSRRRHTRSDRDWSSDVCSSDLPPQDRRPDRGRLRHRRARGGGAPGRVRGVARLRREIGRAAGRERGGVSGGAGAWKKKKTKGGGRSAE